MSLTKRDRLCLHIAAAEQHAVHAHDGHLTIMRFTTGWKAMFGTPDLTGGAGREQVRKLPAFKSLEEALRSLRYQCDVWLDLDEVIESTGPTHAETLKEFENQWVALEGSDIIAHGTDAAEVIKAARRRGIKKPYVFFVEPHDNIIMFGI